MPSCLIKGCFNTWKQRDSKIILHVFPRDKVGIRSWLSQSPEAFPNVEELVEKIYSHNAYGTVRLCSKHFNDDQYYHEGTKRRLRPNAVPTIFTFESPPSEIPGTKRKRKAANTDLSKDGETDDGASSSVLFFTQTDGDNALVQQVLPSHLQIVVPSTSLLAKPKMADKASNTYPFFSKKCQAVGTDPMLGKKNVSMQTKPWKGKSQGVLCTILNGETPAYQHKYWKRENPYEKKNIRYPSASKMVMGQVGNNEPPKQEFVTPAANSQQGMIPKEENEPQPISQDVKVEPMSPHSDCRHSPSSNQDGSCDSESSTDVDSDQDGLSTRNSLDNVEGHLNDAADGAKFTVLQSCLYDLIKLVRCQYRNTCHAPLTNVQIKTLGSVMAIDVLCSRGHNSTLWHSQTAKSKMPAGNPMPTSGGPSQQSGGLEVKTYIHNLE